VLFCTISAALFALLVQFHPLCCITYVASIRIVFCSRTVRTFLVTFGHLRSCLVIFGSSFIYRFKDFKFQKTIRYGHFRPNQRSNQGFTDRLVRSVFSYLFILGRPPGPSGPWIPGSNKHQRYDFW